MPLLSVPQVADHLGLSDANVRALIRRGDLPAVKLGRAYRVDPIHLAQRLQALARSNRRSDDSAGVAPGNGSSFSPPTQPER